MDVGRAARAPRRCRRPRSVFSPPQIHRAQDYRDLGYAITLAALAAQLLGGLAAGAVGAPAGGRACRRSCAAAVPARSLISAAALPFDFWAHRRAVDVGLDLQSDAGWARDALLACAVQARGRGRRVRAGAVAYRRFGPAGVAVAAWLAVAVFTLLQPVLIDPLFIVDAAAASRRLPPQAAALEQHDGRASGARSGSADASSRTTGENAEVDGLGPTVRVVVDDTAAALAPPAQLRALLAHELGHVQRMHTLRACSGSG